MTTVTLPRATVEQALDDVIENARLLGATQAKKGFGCYSEEDANLEGACHKGIAKHSAALRAALAQEPQTTHSAECWRWHHKCAIAEVERLRAALAQQAWVCPESPEHRYAKPGHCEDCGRTLVLAQQAEQKPCSTDPRAPHGFDRTASHTAGRYVCECEHWQAEHFCDTHCTWADHAAGCVRAEPVQEPVAWVYTGIKQDGTEHGPHLVWKPEYMDAMSASKGAKATPLYAAPPQRKPLTDAEIPALAEQVLKPSVYHDAEALIGTDGLVALVRAVEQAHNIKE